MKGKEGERGAIQVRDKMSPEQSDYHDRLVNLRHRAISHFYRGENFGDLKMSESYAFVLEQSTGWLPCVTQRSVMSVPLVLEAIEAVLPSAETLVLAKYREHLRSIARLLDEHANRDDLEALASPAEAFFGNADVAAAITASAAAGGQAAVLE